mmetsp:Transcript_12586/g.32107  ORF Transcript_12586/g.32107 Transcript_12586/m.32107 type:complete len:257 (+) Transcript_12586:208-978(+)
MKAALSQRWVAACNKVGAQTAITIVNHTVYPVLVTLEVAGVVYQREMLPPNEAQEDSYTEEEGGSLLGNGSESQRQFYHSNFAAVKLSCGRAWYTVGAVVCHTSELSEDWVQAAPKRRLHFVFGGSTVSVHNDADTDSKIRLVNDSATGQNDLASERLEQTISTASDKFSKVYREHINPTVNKARESMREGLRHLSEAVAGSDSEYGSSTFRGEHHSRDQPQSLSHFGLDETFDQGTRYRGDVFRQPLDPDDLRQY